MSVRNYVLGICSTLFGRNIGLSIPQTTNFNLAVCLAQDKIETEELDKLNFVFKQDPKFTCPFYILNSQPNAVVNSNICTDIFSFLSKGSYGNHVFFAALSYVYAEHLLMAGKTNEHYVCFCLSRSYNIFCEFIKKFCDHISKGLSWQSSDTRCLDLILTCFINQLTGSFEEYDCMINITCMLEIIDADKFYKHFNCTLEEYSEFLSRFEKYIPSVYVKNNIQKREALYIVKLLTELAKNLAKCNGDCKEAIVLFRNNRKIISDQISGKYGKNGTNNIEMSQFNDAVNICNHVLYS